MDSRLVGVISVFEMRCNVADGNVYKYYSRALECTCEQPAPLQEDLSPKAEGMQGGLVRHGTPLLYQ